MPALCTHQHGHCFEPRYSYRAPTPEQLDEAEVEAWPDADDTVRVIEALTSRVYVCDVCIRCGMTSGLHEEIAVVQTNDSGLARERDWAKTIGTSGS